MNDPAVELRRHLPSLLSSIPEGKNWLLANSVSRLGSEPDLFAKVNLLLALARCCEGRKDIAEDLMRLPASNELLMEWAKAFPLMVAGASYSNDSDSAAEAVLLPWTKPEEFECYLRSCSFSGISDAEEFFADLMERLTRAAQNKLIQALCRVLPNIKNDVSASMLAEACLTKVFSPDRMPACSSELNEIQRIILFQIHRTYNSINPDEDYQRVMDHLNSTRIFTDLGIKSRKSWIEEEWRNKKNEAKIAEAGNTFTQ
jgi:hypothetical protein